MPSGNVFRKLISTFSEFSYLLSLIEIWLSLGCLEWRLFLLPHLTYLKARRWSRCLLALQCCIETGISILPTKICSFWSSCHLVTLRFFTPWCIIQWMPHLSPTFMGGLSTLLLTGLHSYSSNAVIILTDFSIHFDDSSYTMASPFLISSSLTF